MHSGYSNYVKNHINRIGFPQNQIHQTPGVKGSKDCMSQVRIILWICSVLNENFQCVLT